MYSIFKGVKMTKKFLSFALASVLSCGIAFAADSNNKNNKAMRASAPPVSFVDIVQVYSQQGGTEILTEGQTSTNLNHGGNPFEVVTGVLGYGGSSTDSATFAGNQAKFLQSKGIDIDNDNIIDGWWEWWDISKPANSSGEFIYTARSINPGPTMSASIYIK